MSYDRLRNSTPSTQEASANVKVWTGPMAWKVLAGRGEGRSEGERKIHPLPIAIRLDTPLTIGTKGFIPASKLIWVSPSRDPLAVKTLEAVLIPN